MKSSIDGMTHFKCKRKYGLDGLVSVWEYDGVIRKAIVTLKYKFAFKIASELADNAVNELKSGKFILLKNPVLIPIPLYWYRENWRGFNQVEEIGKLVASKMGWKFIPDLLIRKVGTKSQTELGKKDRLSNVRGVFILNPNYLSRNSSSLIHNSVIIFDDVWTTGSTLKEAAKVLKRSGFKDVWGLTLTK